MKKRVAHLATAPRWAFPLLGVIVLMVGITLISVFQLPGRNLLTGAPTQTTTASITINAAPVILFVSNGTTISIIEGTSRLLNFSFLANDSEGRGDLDNSTARLRISLAGEADRFNTTCQAIATVGGNINYSCSVDLWYFDGAGNWIINASISDINGVYAENRSSNFSVQSTTAFAINPSALTWAALELGTTNRTSNNDPITLNNTGNKDVATTGITLTGYNLRGLTTTSEFINAPNFSVSNLNGTSSCSGITCLECNGTIMANATIETLPNAILSAGNYSRNYQNDTSGQENLFFCLMTVPSEISRQTYDTSAGQTAPWVITIT